jgi:hypothetical protein
VEGPQGRTSTLFSPRIRRPVFLLALITFTTGLASGWQWWQTTRALSSRLDSLAANLTGTPAICAPVATTHAPAGGLLASWQTVAGCGAGPSVGTGGGVKWIGRNVRGGMFHVECQANYVDMPYGYNFVGTTLVSHDLASRWNVGVSVPYLYKFMNNPYDVGVDLTNKGPGDITLLVTHRLGALQTWNLTLAVGAPTGTADVQFRRELLPQDRQLGLGRPTASLVIDHTIDRDWGPVVLGGTAGWRGGTNRFGSYRAPSATVYSYAGYLLGAFVPAIGLSATAFAGLDEDRTQEQAMPVVSVAANASLEWSTDWVAILLGASLPYDYAVRSESIPTYSRIGAWTLSLGAAFAVF